MTANNKAASSNWLKRVGGSPQYTAEDKARTARNLNFILPAAIVLLGLRLAFAFVQQQSHWVGFDFGIMVFMLVLGGLWVLSRRGHTLAAATLLLSLTFICMVYLASEANGIFDSAFLALTLVILMAGLLMDWKAAIVMLVLSIAAAWWLARFDAGSEVVLPANAATDYALGASIIFALMGVLIYLLVSNLHRALTQSRANEQVMRAQNAELTSMRATLEQRVAARTAQLRTAADVGRVAASILNPDELLSEIVTLITERFGFYYAAVFLMDHSGTYAVLREATGEAGRVMKERGHRLRVGLDSMVGYAVMKREPRVALNAGEDTVRFANPLLPDTRSEIALPLIVGDQTLGALNVQATQVNAFDEATIVTLQNVAAQIAVALQNAESYNQQQRALEYATRQYELSRTIFAASTSKEAYESLGRVFALLSGIDRIIVLQVAERDALGQPAEYELATEWEVLGGAQFNTGLRYTAAEAPLAQLVTEDEVIIIHDAQDNRLPLTTREQLARVGAQAAMLVPLLMRGQFEGYIAAVAEQAHDFQDSEVRLVTSAAEQLGVVLSSLQLTEEMQTTLDRVDLLNRRLSGEAWGSYLTSRDQLRVESGQTPSTGIDTSLHVPIIIRGQTIGMFNVADAKTDRQWQDEEVTMLQTIAGEVALAIENTRLIEQTQHTAQREKDIASAADKIHRTVNLDAILRTAVEEVMRITGTTEVAIQLGRPRAVPGNDRQPQEAQA